MTTSNSSPRRRPRPSDPRRRGPQKPRRFDARAKKAPAAAPVSAEQRQKREELRLDRFRTQANSIIEALRAVITGVFERNFPADRVLAEFLRTNRGCGSRDRAAISATVYAVLRGYGALRAMLPEAVYSRIERGDADFSPGELAALGCCGLIFEGEHDDLARSLAQVYGLPAIPPCASTKWADRAQVAADFTGFGSAVAVETLLPAWLKNEYPGDFGKLARLFARRPPMWLRLQGSDEKAVLDELRAAGLSCRRHERVPGAVAVTGGKVNVFTLNSFRNGGFEVQDLASQCVGLVCAPKPGERWFDACAGGGGKTLELASLMRRRGTVIAGDVRTHILHELKLRARRGGFPNISTLAHEGRVPRGFHPCDGVLVDAPCSGSGVWRRNPGSVWKFRPADIAAYAARQTEILSRFSAAVKPGGVLVYATCSLFPAENEAVAERFLVSHPDFALESGTHPLTGLITDGMYHFDGFADDCDFLFAARFRRKYGANNG